MLECEFVEIEPICVLAIRHIGPYNECGKAWERMMKYAYTQKIKLKKNLMGKSARMFGVGYDNPNVVEASKLRCDVCITKDDDVVLEDGIREMVISGGRFARFLHKGPYEALAEKYVQIYGIWMAENSIMPREEPPFEEYLNRDPRRTKPQNLRTHIYIPI